MATLKQIHRTLPYNFRLVNAATIDIADAMSRDATRNKETGQILATVNVYDNESRVAFEVSEDSAGCSGLLVSMLSPAPALSENGQDRTLVFLADSIEQLIENTLRESRKRSE